MMLMKEMRRKERILYPVGGEGRYQLLSLPPREHTLCIIDTIILIKYKSLIN